MLTKMQTRLEAIFTSKQFTYKQLRSMFLTLMLDQFFIIFIGVLSTAMVASTGEAAIAAANMVGSINGIVYLMFTAMAMGGAIMIARAKGRDDLQGVRLVMGETIAMSTLVGSVLAAVLYAFSEPMVKALYGSAEPLLIEYAVHYLRLLCISALPYATFSAIFNALRSLGDTKSSLFLTVVINVLHLVCCILFINVMKLGITGAGLSYIVARLVGGTLAVLWVLKIHNPFGLRVKHCLRMSRKTVGEILRMAVPIAWESLLFQGGMLLVQIYLAKLTTTEMAAHGIANSFLQLYNITGQSAAALTSTVCGQCFGAGLFVLTRQYCRKLIVTCRVALLVTVAALLPLAGLILQLYHPTAEAMPVIRTCIYIASVGIPIIWADGYVTPNMLRATGDALYPTVVSVVALFAGRIALGYYLTIVAGMGVPGMWLSMLVEWLIRAVCFRVRLHTTPTLKRPDKPIAAEA